MKNILEGINGKLDNKEKWIHNLEDKVIEITHWNNKKKKNGRKKSVKNLWDNIKCTNIHNIGVSEGEKREKKGQKIYMI